MGKGTKEVGKNDCFDYKGFEFFKHLLILPWLLTQKTSVFWGVYQTKFQLFTRQHTTRQNCLPLF